MQKGLGTCLKNIKDSSICRVFKNFGTYRKNKSSDKIAIETIETIVENDHIETVNTIRREPKPVYSLKIKCKIQMQSWALELVGLPDTDCSNTILDEKLVPP